MVFLSNGAPVSGKTGQISLENSFSILPGAQQSFQWSFCLNDNLERAIDTAINGINATWEAEIARIDIINQKDLFEVDKTYEFKINNIEKNSHKIGLGWPEKKLEKTEKSEKPKTKTKKAK